MRSAITHGRRAQLSRRDERLAVDGREGKRVTRRLTASSTIARASRPRELTVRFMGCSEHRREPHFGSVLGIKDLAALRDEILEQSPDQG